MIFSTTVALEHVFSKDGATTNDNTTALSVQDLPLSLSPLPSSHALIFDALLLGNCLPNWLPQDIDCSRLSTTFEGAITEVNCNTTADATSILADPYPTPPPAAEEYSFDPAFLNKFLLNLDTQGVFKNSLNKKVLTVVSDFKSNHPSLGCTIISLANIPSKTND